MKTLITFMMACTILSPYLSVFAQMGKIVLWCLVGQVVGAGGWQQVLVSLASEEE